MKLGGNNNGSASILAMMVIAGISLVVLYSLVKRTQNDLSQAMHMELVADEGQVLKALSFLGDCPSPPPPCSLGSTLEIKSKMGKPLVASDGSLRIGRWNVRIDCLNSPGLPAPEYKVMIGRVMGNKVLVDPLTKKPQPFRALTALKDACGTKKNASDMLLSNVCYGAIEGKQPLPPGRAQDCGDCQFKNTFCGDDQLPFPSCPEGYYATFTHIDRYGWGGIDMTKYTLCRKNK